MQAKLDSGLEEVNSRSWVGELLDEIVSSSMPD